MEPDKIAACFVFVCIWIWNFLQDRKADRLQSHIERLEQRINYLDQRSREDSRDVR